MVMQTIPGGVYSMTDFFVTSAGIVGSETTIRGFHAFRLRDPICCRIRECMQYGRTLEEYAERLQKRNSGDYACSWMFGDIQGRGGGSGSGSGPRIMRVELGLNYVNIETTRDGVFLGFNSTYDERIRAIECSSVSGGLGGGGELSDTDGFHDVTSSIGNRRVQLEKLTEKYRGRIDTTIVKRILADHFDNHLGKTAANSRTICKHAYADTDGSGFGSGSASAPFKPVGAYDAKVTDSALIRRMSFLAHLGPPCGTPFSVREYMKKHPEWKDWEEYLVDYPKRGWVEA
jgi:hypothetical protein